MPAVVDQWANAALWNLVYGAVHLAGLPIDGLGLVVSRIYDGKLPRQDKAPKNALD
jgi:hypothetical protein